MAGDWIKLHRKIIESQVFGDAGTLRLWVYLLTRANYKPSFFRGRRIEVGQVAFSYRLLAEALDTSVGTVNRQIHRLQDWGNITLHVERDFSVATVCQWATYQCADDLDGTPADTRSDTQVERKWNANGHADGHANRHANRHVPKKERRVRSEEGKKPDSSEPAAGDSEPSVMDFPTVGKVKSWGLTQTFVDSLQEAFPGVDVLAECRKARAWCEANAAKRKTPKGMQKFLFGWMERNQNRRGGVAATAYDDPRGTMAAMAEYLESE